MRHGPVQNFVPQRVARALQLVVAEGPVEKARRPLRFELVHGGILMVGVVNGSGEEICHRKDGQ